MKHRLYYNKIRKSKWNSIKNFKKISNFYLGMFFIFSPYAILNYGQFIKTFTRFWADEFFNSVFMDYFIGGSKISIAIHDKLKFIIYSKNFFKFFYFYELFSRKLSLDMNKKKRMPHFLTKINKNFIVGSFFLKIYDKYYLSPKVSSRFLLINSILKLNNKLLARKLKMRKRFFLIIKTFMLFILNIIFSNLKNILNIKNFN